MDKAGRAVVRRVDQKRAPARGPRFVIQMVGFGAMIVLALALFDSSQFGRRDALAGLLPLLGLLAFAGQRSLPELQVAYHAVTTLTMGTAALVREYADLCVHSIRVLDCSDPQQMRLTEALTLSDVSYIHPGAHRAGLGRYSVIVRAGERIGIIGPSGAGKTTLADVLRGLLQSQSGELCVDGEALTQENICGWQRAVGYVPKDTFLTDASLSANIALGLRPEEVDQYKIERAARSALLHDFAINELSDGYETHIGERGVRLSGGQRQRIGIARALYHDADLIVFDEATIALDNLTEAEVMTTIDALPGDKTIMIIAHRLSTVRCCDRIVMLERGRLPGIGSWDELYVTSAAFRGLVHAA